MLVVLILVVFAVVVLVLILLAIVVVAIRQEPRDVEMSHVAPSPIAVMVRRLLGSTCAGLLPSRQHQGVANHRVDRDDNPSARRKEVRNHCRHTPSSK
jgi:heme/copper-type cytochrome/quinol oxidase subunit 2